MENTTSNSEIDWIDDFRINETLHAAASTISGTYGRLSFNFKNNPDEKIWNKEGIEWHQYYKKINDFNFKTEGEAKAEVDRVSKICKEVLDLEKKLELQNG
jgi:hypothetical protein